MLKEFFIFAILFLAGIPAFAGDLSNCIIFDVPKEEIESQFGKPIVSQLTRQDSMAIVSYRFIGDTLRVLVVLVEWDNRSGTYSPTTFDSLFFSRDVFPGGSVADYYYEVSYGQVIVVGQVIDWHNAGWYSTLFDYYSLFAALNPFVDYSQFDGNHDGDVDGVFFIRAGNGYEDSHNPNDIWSFAQVYPPGTGPGPYDGVRISGWNASPETRLLHDPLNPRFFTGVNARNRVRVFCHFLAHCLGLPDLFDHDNRIDTSTFYTPGDYNAHPVQDWCVMGYEGYGIFSLGSEVPSHLCGWSKKEAGWIEPVVLSPGADYHLTIRNIETTKDSSLYLLPINPAEGEYFLLEYRNPGSTAKFDKLNSDYSAFFWPALTYGGDPLDRGLIITHVHDSLDTPYFRMNYGTPDYPHYRVKIEDAGYNPNRDAHSNPGGWVTDSAQWWYPYETQIAAAFSNNVPGQEVFSPATYPNSDGYFGPSGIIVRVDPIINDKLYAYVNIPTPTFLLLSPLDSAFAPYVVTFDWADPYPWPWGEVRYDLYISTSPNFLPDSTIIHDSLLTSEYTDTLEIGKYYWKVRAYNKHTETWSNQTWNLLSALLGDTDGDGKISLSDVILLANYVLKGGLPPYPLEAGDVNCDGKYDLVDVIKLARYVLFGAPFPC
jgi:M6 family metalloprotease-like protein